MVKRFFLLSIFSVSFFSSPVHAGELKNYFKDSYEEARSLFLKNVSELKNQTPSLQHQERPVPSLSSENLFTDTLYLPPPSGKKERLLILVSGIHGIEGYVGSALQNLFIEERFFGQRDENLGILLVHALNPHGFKFKRRVSENNVDLNRNLDTARDLFHLKNPGYQNALDLLFPEKPATNGALSRMEFYYRCIKSILQHSMDSLRRAILRGQYEFPKGIYYGGNDFEFQKELLEREFLEFSAGYSQVLLVDMHTGYGERGRLHLLADRTPAMDPKYLAEVFSGHFLDYGKDKDFYEVTGGLVVYGAKLLKGKTRYAGIVFEFGTLDSQKTFGSLDSLYRMVRENQLHHYGAHSESEADEIRHLFYEMFYPQDPQWRESITQQFRDILSSALKNQKALN